MSIIYNENRNIKIFIQHNGTGNNVGIQNLNEDYLIEIQKLQTELKNCKQHIEILTGICNIKDCTICLLSNKIKNMN